MSSFGPLAQMQEFVRYRLLGAVTQGIATILFGDSAAHKYVVSLCGQATVGMYHFLLNIFLVRTLEASDYGLFALAFVLATLGTAVTSALFATPLAVYVPTVAWSARRSFVEVLLSTGNVVLVASMFFLACFLGIWFNLSVETVLAFAGFISVYAVRHYTRAFAFARRRPAVATVGDILYVLLGLGMLVSLVRLEHSISVALALGMLIIGNCAAICLECATFGVGRLLALRWRALPRYRVIWKEARWALLGASTTILQAQAHSLLVSIVAGPAVYAALAAGQIPFGPVRIGIFAWHSVMRPELAVAIAQHDRRTVIRTLWMSAAFMAAGVAAVAAALVLFWQPISRALYINKYGTYPMGWVVAGSCAIILCATLSAAPSGVLQAFRDFRTLALATVYGSAISLVSAACLLVLSRAEATLIGILLAEIFVVGYAFNATMRRIRQQW